MIFSILAFIALIISVCIRERQKSLIVQSASCLFESIYDFIISAYTGAVLSFMNFVRTFLFIKKEKFSKLLYLIILFLFESIIIVNCFVTWEGYISLLPTIGSIIRTYCLWQSEMKLVRISGITTGILYGAYYLYYHSWFMVLGDSLLIIVGIYSLLQNDIKKNIRSINK